MQSFLIVLVIFFILITLLYNFLVSKKNQVANIFGSVDALLKKRFDLIPSLIASVQEAMQHEKGVLKEITALRTNAMNSSLDVNKMAKIDSKMSTLLGTLMVAVEAYPDLKANENTMHLQRSLVELEEQLSAARRAYNQAVTDYNNAIEMIPANILANFLRYEKKSVFEIPVSQRENVDVKELFKK
ncbi:MAG: LemA family protein [Sulfurospirillum sp.]|nr:LemA family protein [Sulfurospirillum sp.]